MKRMSSIVLAILAWALLVGASNDLRVSVDSGKLDMFAREVPLVDIMTALDEQAEITFRVIGDAEINQFRISDEFHGLPLDKAIARLLRGLSYSVVRDKAGISSKVIILGKDELGGSWENRSYTNFEGNEAVDNASEMSQSPTEASTIETGHSPQTAEDELVQAVETAQAARTPEEKAEALRILGNFQDSRTLEALQPALQAEQTEVRRAALEAMRWGTVYDPNALREVRNLAAEDKDPQVKRSALEVIVRYDNSAEARELLEGVAQSSDKTLGEFASRELQRMDAEAAVSSAEVEQQDIQQEERAALIDEAAVATPDEVEHSELQPEGEPVALMTDEGETPSAEVEQEGVLQPSDEAAATVEDPDRDQ